MSDKKRFFQKGEIATVLTVLSAVLILLGIAVGTNLVQKPTRLKTEAAIKETEKRDCFHLGIELATEKKKNANNEDVVKFYTDVRIISDGGDGVVRLFKNSWDNMIAGPNGWNKANGDFVYDSNWTQPEEIVIPQTGEKSKEVTYLVKIDECKSANTDSITCTLKVDKDGIGYSPDCALEKPTPTPIPTKKPTPKPTKLERKVTGKLITDLYHPDKFVMIYACDEVKSDGTLVCNSNDPSRYRLVPVINGSPYSLDFPGEDLDFKAIIIDADRFYNSKEEAIEYPNLRSTQANCPEVEWTTPVSDVPFKCIIKILPGEHKVIDFYLKVSEASTKEGKGSVAGTVTVSGKVDPDKFLKIVACRVTGDKPSDCNSNENFFLIPLDDISSAISYSIDNLPAGRHALSLIRNYYDSSGNEQGKHNLELKAVCNGTDFEPSTLLPSVCIVPVNADTTTQLDYKVKGEGGSKSIDFEINLKVRYSPLLFPPFDDEYITTKLYDYTREKKVNPIHTFNTKIMNLNNKRKDKNYRFLAQPLKVDNYSELSLDEYNKMGDNDVVFEVHSKIHEWILCGNEEAKKIRKIDLGANLPSKLIFNMNLDCILGPDSEESDFEIQRLSGSSNQSYQEAIDCYQSGECTAEDVSVFLDQVVRTPGVQIQYFEPGAISL